MAGGSLFEPDVSQSFKAVEACWLFAVWGR